MSPLYGKILAFSCQKHNFQLIFPSLMQRYKGHHIMLLNLLITSGLLILLHRGSYMSAHVLLNLLNKLKKRDKMRGLLNILSLFRNKFNKFNNTKAQMLDSIYHMTSRLL